AVCIVRALPLGRNRVVVTAEVELRLRAHRETDARAEVETELAVAHRGIRSERGVLILEGRAVVTRAGLSKEARTDHGAEVHPEFRRHAEHLDRARMVVRTVVPIHGAQVVHRSLETPRRLRSEAAEVASPERETTARRIRPEPQLAR